MERTTYFVWISAGILASCLSMTACKDDADKNSDTGTGPDTLSSSSTAEDTGTTTESESESQSEAAAPECVSNGFMPALQTARTSNLYGAEYLAFSSETTPYDQVIVRMKFVDGRYADPGTYALSGADLSQCTNCVIGGRNCNSDGCEKLYVGSFGSIVAESVGPFKKPMKGSLSGVIMQEVEVDETTGATTAKAGGDVWCLDNYAYDAQMLGFAEGSCVRPSTHCVGETVPDFTLTSCDSGDVVSMQTLAQGKKAVLFVLVTGWCPVCTKWLPEIIPYAEGRQEEGLEVVYVFGEGNVGQAPTLESCAAYAASYADHADGALLPHFYMDEYGPSWFMNFTEAMSMYPTGDGATGVPFNAIIDPASFDYHWYGSGAVGTSQVAGALSPLL